MRNKLIAIDGDENAYAIGLFNIEESKYIKIVTCFSFEDLMKELSIIHDDDCFIIFNNQLMKVNRFLHENYESSLIYHTNIFQNRVYGIFPSKKIKDYGFNISAVKATEHVTNLVDYIILKNKGL